MPPDARRNGTAPLSRRLERIGGLPGVDLLESAGPIRARLARTTWRLLNDRERSAPDAREPR
ncbi:hypothetical protein OG339_33730 [Streptosporangium sp. NBC_01495]|uniref:hypothetical protein n=1 Tax=Streptosporangium sp. NBC_01495 TaxID=2903899 RepID=UPI002E339ABF|nr:hypothetical protein [Streptosporangium sp. NBC_01495]